MKLFISNTNLLWLYHLKSVAEDAYMDDADVTLTITNEAGQAVAGETWPMALTAIGDSPATGGYIGVLSDGMVLTPNANYVAVVDVDGGPGRIGHWEIPFTAKTRTQ